MTQERKHETIKASNVHAFQGSHLTHFSHSDEKTLVICKLRYHLCPANNTPVRTN